LINYQEETAQLLKGQKVSQRAVAQIPFCSLKILFDHSKARFRQFPNSPCGLEQRKLLFFRFAKNGYQKFFNIRCRGVAVWATAPTLLTNFDCLSRV